MISQSFLPGLEWMLIFVLFAATEDFVWRNAARSYYMRCLRLFRLGRISRVGIGAAERRDRFEILRGVEVEWLSDTCAVLRHRWDSWFGPGPLRFAAEGDGELLEVRARIAWWWVLSAALVPASPFVFLPVFFGSAVLAVEQWRKMAEDLSGSRRDSG